MPITKLPNHRTSLSVANSIESPSRRELIKGAIALAGGSLLGMHSIEAQASSGTPEVFQNHPDPAIRDAWRHRNNTYGIERIYGFTRRKSHDFTAFPHVMREESKATPEYHWILLRSIPNYFFFDHFSRNGSPKKEKDLTINYETQKPLWYLVQGMWQYWEEKNYSKAEIMLLSSYFSLIDLSEQDANKVGLTKYNGDYKTFGEFKELKPNPNVIHDSYSYKVVDLENKIKNTNLTDLIIQDYAYQFKNMSLDAKEKVLKSISQEFWGKKSLKDRKLAYWTLALLNENFWRASGRPKKEERSDQYTRYDKMLSEETHNIIDNDRRKENGFTPDGKTYEFGYTLFRPTNIWE